MLRSVLSLAAAAGLASAVTIAEINGAKYQSALNGTTVTGVKGLVTAKNAQGVFLRSTEPDDDERTSESVFLFNTAVRSQVQVGDIVTLDATVEEYRSNNLYTYLTELTKPLNVKVVSSGNEVTPLILGEDTLSPPTELFSSLDEGGIFGVPNDVTRISAQNPTLQPDKYGMDFWESLVGELVTIKDVVQVARPNQYGDVWVRAGSLKATGVNSHGGLTMLEGDANPEAITIGTPCDGSKNPSDTKMGDSLGDVTGIVFNAFGFYRILPLTAVSSVESASVDFPSASFNSTGDCRGITVGSYNAENLNPESAHLPGVIDQIIEKMLTPDVIFLQEVQDGSGDANDGVVSGNATLMALSEGIESKSGVVYEWAEVAPVNNQDGGAPGGNIRQAYLYRPDVVELYNPNQGGANDKAEIVTDEENPSWPVLSYNPGRIEPAAEAWSNSRKPLVAQWKPLKGTGKTFFTINVHFGSKGGSSSLHGDPRPPINKGVEKREEQATITANFIAEILAIDPKARIITAGDFNEFTQVAPLQKFMSIGSMLELDDVANVAPEERYTYLFDMNSQQLDHMFVTANAAKEGQTLLEHLHLNTWQNYDDQVSDHDPSVAKLNLCGCA